MRNTKIGLRMIGIGVLLLGLAPVVRGQSSEALLLVPWDRSDETIEAHGDGYLMPETELEHFHSGLSLFESEASGRYRFGTQYALEPSVGFGETSLFLNDHGHHALPGNLTDMSIAGGTPFGLVKGWFVAATAGVGYAGQDPVADSSGWYGKGSIMVGKEVKPNSYLIVALDYDGNREFLPDVPLPGVEYRSQWSPDLQYTVGAPVNALAWTPRPDFTLNVKWVLIREVDAMAEYKLDDQWTAFGSFAMREEPFHDSNLPDDQRIFFRETRAELGLRWEFSKIAGIQLAAGYSFARSFTTGFDDRDLNGISDLRNEPYVRIGLHVSN